MFIPNFILVTPTILNTPYYHEFQSNITRIGNNINNVVDYNVIEPTPTEIVIDAIPQKLSILLL